MGYQKYVKELWKKPKKTLREENKLRLIQWRRDPATLRIERPTRIDRARNLGYKAIQGIIMVRQRVKRGGHTRPKIRHGRRPKHFTQRKVLNLSYKTIAEQRANKKFKNCEVLNSYFVLKDGNHSWYEIILVDRNHPRIKKDKQLSWIKKKKGRVFRGLTSAGKKSRGLRNKGKGAEKHRPSLRARGKKGQ